MRADRDIDLALGKIRQRRLDLLRRAEAAEHLDPHRERLEAALERLEMLKRQHRGRRQHRHLLAVAQRLERGAHHDFGLAEAHVAAEQPVHGLRALHVAS